MSRRFGHFEQVEERVVLAANPLTAGVEGFAAEARIATVTVAEAPQAVNSSVSDGVNSALTSESPEDVDTAANDEHFATIDVSSSSHSQLAPHAGETQDAEVMSDGDGLLSEQDSDQSDPDESKAGSAGAVIGGLAGAIGTRNLGGVAAGATVGYFLGEAINDFVFEDEDTDGDGVPTNDDNGDDFDDIDTSNWGPPTID